MPIILSGQQSLNEEEAAELKKSMDKALEAEILAKRIPSGYKSPRLYLYYHYLHDKSKKKLELEQKRYQEKKLHPDETLEQLADKILKSKELVKKKELLIKGIGLSLAQSIAVKSLKEEDPNIQGLLAKEAYDLNLINGGDPKDPFIYEAVYKALYHLEAVNRNNTGFNVLDQSPEGYTRVGRIRHIQIPKGDEKIYTIGSDGLLLKWNFNIYGSKSARRNYANKPEILSDDRSVSRAFDLSPDGKNLAIAGDCYKTIICDAKNGQIRKELCSKKERRVWALKYTLDGDGIITIQSEQDKETTIYYTNMDGGSTPIIKNIPHQLTRTALSSGDKYLAGIGKSSEVWIWDIKNQRRDFVLNNPHSEKRPTAVTFDPLDRFVVVGYQDGSIMIWDLVELNNNPNYFPKKLVYHQSSISAVNFNHEGTSLIVGSLDKTATLWTIRDKKDRGYYNQKELPYLNPKYNPIKLGEHGDWVTSVAFSNDGTRVITGTVNGRLKLWEIDLTFYADQICSLINLPDKNLDYTTWQKYIGTNLEEPEGKEFYLDYLTSMKKYRCSE
jgi:WD40 repeat protein